MSTYYAGTPCSVFKNIRHTLINNCHAVGLSALTAEMYDSEHLVTNSIIGQSICFYEHSNPMSQEFPVSCKLRAQKYGQRIDIL